MAGINVETHPEVASQERSVWSCGARPGKAGIWTREQGSQTEVSVHHDVNVEWALRSGEDDEIISCAPLEGEEDHDSDDGISDVDISLALGEVKARLLQDATPDEDRFCECSPGKVEIS